MIDTLKELCHKFMRKVKRSSERSGKKKNQAEEPNSKFIVLGQRTKKWPWAGDPPLPAGYGYNTWMLNEVTSVLACHRYDSYDDSDIQM